MRMLFKVSMDIEASNKAIKDGTLQKLIQSTYETIRPEASYYYAENGKRTAYFYFDLKDSSEIPQICEPWFMGANAEVDFRPVMNQEELGRGLEAWARKYR